jgi:predicted esterase
MSERTFDIHPREFSAPVPVWSSIHPTAGPDAPLVVYCHGMSEDPATLPRFWPHLCSLPVHLLAPAGPLPHEIRSREGIRLGHAWYLYDGGTEPFKSTLTRSGDWLAEQVTLFEENAGLRPRARALVGYSQGAYFSSVTALHHQNLFGHLIAVAGGRLRADFVDRALAEGGPLRILLLHGRDDKRVSPDLARDAAEQFTGAGYASELQLLERGHGLHPDRDVAAAAWLTGEWALAPAGS